MGKKKTKKVKQPKPESVEEIKVTVVEPEVKVEKKVTPQKNTEKPTVKSTVEEATKKAEDEEPSAPWFHDQKLLLLVGIVLALTLIAAITVMAWQNTRPSSDHKVVTEQRKKSKTTDKVEVPTVLPRHADGIMVATADANAVPACVMIENAAFDGVRPQSGLSAASVVYEVVVEGGITRLMAIFAGEAADEVGPVRSARDTYIEFVSEYNCGYVHAGGSYTAMQAIPRFELRDIDALYEGKWFWRDSSKYSPHNLFTNTENLYKAMAEGHSWTEAPVYATWNFVDDADLPDGITSGDPAVEVNIEFGGSYDVTYTYNADAKYYERANAGITQVDANNDRTLSVRNIILQHVPAGDYIEGKGRVNFSVTGEGAVEVVRNGVVTKGTWKKANRLDRTRFYDEAGVEIPLARGNTWVEVVPEGYTFNWK